MKKLVAMKWAKALRSGEYQQTRQTLQDDTGYCCLGVLCNIAEKEGVQVRKDIANRILGDELSDQEAVKKWAGFTERRSLGYLYAGQPQGDSIVCLTEANDRGQLTFDEIADIIENEWENIT